MFTDGDALLWEHLRLQHQDQDVCIFAAVQMHDLASNSTTTGGTANSRDNDFDGVETRASSHWSWTKNRSSDPYKERVCYKGLEGKSPKNRKSPKTRRMPKTAKKGKSYNLKHKLLALFFKWSNYYQARQTTTTRIFPALRTRRRVLKRPRRPTRTIKVLDCRFCPICTLIFNNLFVAFKNTRPMNF